MANYAFQKKHILLWGAMLLLAGGLFHQMTTPSTPENTPRATTVMQQYTATLRPSATPKPTVTPKLTATPRPTATPKPTATPRPTATPKPTATIAAESYQVKISYTAQCGNYNHVGNAWRQEFYVNGEAVRGSKTLSIHPGESIQLEVIITEEDTYPDVGSDTQTLVLTDEECKRGTRITTAVDVRENRGRYAGNIAEWTVVYTVTPVK